MFKYKENLRRLKLFKELEPDFKRENYFKRKFKTVPFRNFHNFLYKGEQND